MRLCPLFLDLCARNYYGLIRTACSLTCEDLFSVLHVVLIVHWSQWLALEKLGMSVKLWYISRRPLQTLLGLGTSKLKKIRMLETLKRSVNDSAVPGTSRKKITGSCWVCFLKLLFHIFKKMKIKINWYLLSCYYLQGIASNSA